MTPSNATPRNATPISPTMVNGFTAADFARLPPDEQALVARRASALGPAYRLFYEKPLHFVRGQGVWLYDGDGAAYLDAYNNVASLGHGHRRVVEAIACQLATLNTHTRYLHADIITYAERLLASLNAGGAALDHMMFTCTGSEANDLALRIARAATGATGVIVTTNAYHGVTASVAEFSPSLGAGVALGAHVCCVPAPDGGPDCGQRFAASVEAAIADLAAHGLRPAMLIVDTIFSSDGVIPAPKGFLAPAVAAIRRAGGLFVADEVQPGFGRTGEAMWGFARHNLAPDMVTMGKPMGNGYPMAGVAMRADLVAQFGAQARYFNTYGGNPVAAAAGLAVLDVIRDEGIMANALAVGDYLRVGLAGLARGRAEIGAIRGCGLFIGVDMVDSTGAPDALAAARIVNGLAARRVLISASGPYGNVLKIRPPLVFHREHADVLLSALGQTLAETAPAPAP